MFCQMNVLRWSYPTWSYTHANTLSILKKTHLTTMKKGYNFFLNLLKVKLYTLHRKKRIIFLIFFFWGGGEEGADHRFVQSGPSV